MLESLGSGWRRGSSEERGEQRRKDERMSVVDDGSNNDTENARI